MKRGGIWDFGGQAQIWGAVSFGEEVLGQKAAVGEHSPAAGSDPVGLHEGSSPGE